MTTPRLHEGLCGPAGCFVLEGVLRDRSQVVNLGGNFLSSTEALLLGLPGPARANTSFGAGLRFSPSRKRTLHTFHDEKGMTKQRLVGQPVDYTDTVQPPGLPANPSAWMTFVVRRWKNGDYVKLAIETSRAFVDFDAQARERIGRLYNDIDAIPEMSTDALLTASLDRLRNLMHPLIKLGEVQNGDNDDLGRVELNQFVVLVPRRSANQDDARQQKRLMRNGRARSRQTNNSHC